MVPIRGHQPPLGPKCSDQDWPTRRGPVLVFVEWLRRWLKLVSFVLCVVSSAHDRHLTEQLAVARVALA